MIGPTHLDALKRALVEEARTDTVGLWSILRHVKIDEPSLTDDEAKQITLLVIRSALRRGEVVAGEFVDRDEETAAFVAWEISADQAIEKIEREWAALGREPNLGDVAWFVNPQLLPVTANLVGHSVSTAVLGY
jgi:hypothetical protein